MGTFQECRICGAPTDRSYYTTVSCDPCRTFFRRHVILNKNLSCAANKSCKIIVGSRRNCPACRFQKCLEVGMKADKVEIGLSKSWTKYYRFGNTKKKEHLYPSVTQFPDNIQMIETDVQQEESEGTLIGKYRNPHLVFSKSLALPIIYNDPSRHEYLRVTKTAKSSLQYNVLGVIINIPCTRYDVVIEVPVKKGIICGTNILLDNLVNQKLSFDSKRRLMTSRNSSQSQLELPSRRCYYTFTRKESLVEIEISSSTHKDVVQMSRVSDDHWHRIQQIISATEHFQSIVSPSLVILPNTECSSRTTSDDLTLQKIILSQSSDGYTKQISNLIESFEAFHELDLLDQIIVLKEALFPIHFLLSTHCYSRESNCISYSTLGGHILYGYLISKWKRDDHIYGREMDALFQSYLSQFFTFLREDYFVMNIICLLYIFGDWPGLSCTEVTKRERKLLSEILNKYIDGMNAAGLWSTSRNLVWSNIQQVMKYAFHYKEILTKIQRHLQNTSFGKETV